MKSDEIKVHQVPKKKEADPKRKQERLQVYLQRYQLLAEEMRDIVLDKFKPQVLATIKLGHKL